MRVSHDILVLDGGMSRELVAFGATLRQPEWSGLALIEQPEIVDDALVRLVERATPSKLVAMTRRLRQRVRSHG